MYKLSFYEEAVVDWLDGMLYDDDMMVGGGRAPVLALKWNDDAVCGQESSWAQSVVIVSQQADFFKVSLSDSLIFSPSAGRE